MDAKYLSDNVTAALTEALTSMAVCSPEDGVEYVGKYLLQFVERKNMMEMIAKQNKEVEANALDQRNADAEKEAKAQEKNGENESYKEELNNFVSSLSAIASSKQEAMDRCTEFLATYLKVPAAYVAVKKSTGEVESLNYLSANPGQEHVVGKKVFKQAEDVDEVEPRSGLSFEAFKVPEVPEAEEEEEVPEGEEPPPKVIPQPSPLVINNVMRDSRIKFFGVPKLGAYAAVPFNYKSIDHENGCEMKANEEGSLSYSENALDTSFIIGIDTIGKYRRIKQEEVDVVKTVGDAMVSALESLEKRMYNDQISCFEDLKPVSSSVVESLEAVKSSEDSAGTSAVEDLDEDVKAEQGPMLEAMARAQVWTQKIINAPFRTYFRALQDHALPAPPAVAALFFATGCLLGIEPSQMQDACKDISWEAIKKSTLMSLCSDAFSYDVDGKSEVWKENTVASVRALCESLNLFEPSTYSDNMQGVTAVSIWLQKNLAARESAIAYFKEHKNENIEIVKA